MLVKSVMRPGFSRFVKLKALNVTYHKSCPRGETFTTSTTPEAGGAQLFTTTYLCFVPKDLLVGNTEEGRTVKLGECHFLFFLFTQHNDPKANSQRIDR